MKVPRVSGITVHFDNRRSIFFSKDETAVHLIQTEIRNSDGSQKTDVEYYMITTTPLER